VQFRSLHSLARRGLAAGAASALALTLFNAAQPTLGSRPIGPGTLKDVPLTLGPSAPVDNAARELRGARLPLRGAEPGSGALEAAPKGAAPGAGAREAPGRDRAGRRAAGVGAGGGGEGQVRRGVVAGAAGRAPGRGGRGQGVAAVQDRGRVVVVAGGRAGLGRARRHQPRVPPPERVYGDGQWLDPGTDEVQVKVDPPAAPGAAGPTDGLEAHLIAPDMTPTPGTELPRAGVATAMTTRPAIVSRAAWGARESLRRVGTAA
jgi:hypothetical protein